VLSGYRYKAGKGASIVVKGVVVVEYGKQDEYV
jgi:hypothetical protein